MLNNDVVGNRFHHGTEDYAQANKKAEDYAIAKMQMQIDTGKAQFASLVEQLKKDVPRDHVVKGSELQFGVSGQSILASKRNSTNEYPMHRNAIQQIASVAGIPKVYINSLLQGDKEDEWTTAKKELLSHTLNKYFDKNPGLNKDWLVRMSAGAGHPEIKAFLSNHYKPFNSDELLAGIVSEIGKIGAVASEALFSDLRFSARVIVPKIFTPIPGEPMLFGLEMRHSDYGVGAFSIRGFFIRCWCTNLAIGETAMKEVHLGKRLPSGIRLSPETYQSDTKTILLTAGDVVRDVLGEASIEKTLSTIREAAEEKLTWNAVSKKLSAKMSKGEVARVKDIWDSPMRDMESVPSGNNRYALSNILSFLAKSAPDLDKRLTYQDYAGAIMRGADLVDEDLAALTLEEEAETLPLL